jgi:outer membrane protein OmpA-like peptidoglycan-associated protein
MPNWHNLLNLLFVNTAVLISQELCQNVSFVLINWLSRVEGWSFSMVYKVLLCFVFLLYLASIEVVAQKPEKKKFINISGVLDKKSSEVASIGDFPNVNKVRYYYDKRKWAEIQKYESKAQWEPLYKVLNPYVHNFGIENFYKDTHLLWRLAKLTELYGSEVDAISLYQLVLKHHRDDIDINEVALHYDSLNTDKVDDYVPLDYYYELVEYRKEVDTLQPPRGVLLNMGNAINSGKADYGPTLSINGDLLILTSKRNEKVVAAKKTQNEDLFISHGSEGNWSQVEALEAINTEYNEGSACISSDGSTLYFARCHAPGTMGSCDLFVAKIKEDSTWGNVRNLGVNVNSMSWDSHPTLSHTEDTLFFASDRIGGFGLSDIYFTYKDENGSWTPAQNVGPLINTRGNEVSPFYHPKHQVLYFTSNGHLLNFGSFDIYKSRWLDNRWQEPKNIGPLVNGGGDEFYFTIDSESKNLYYASSTTKDIENLDLFSFPLPMGAQPEANTSFSGILLDSITGLPLSGIVSIIDLDHGIEVAPKFLRSDGTFQFELINNNNYLLIIQGDEYFRIEEIFYLDGATEIRRTAQPLASKLKFESIEFENGKADILPEMYGDLDKIIDFMLDNPDFKVNIAGHTDSDGSPDFNMVLSQQRAAAIRDYVVHFGSISEERVTAVGFGNTKPIVEEVTDADKKLNRRVEFEISRENSED